MRREEISIEAGEVEKRIENCKHLALKVAGASQPCDRLVLRYGGWF